MRRLVQPVFRFLGPSALGPAVSASLALLAARWEALADTGEPTDLAHDMLALALGFTAQLLFGVELSHRAAELADSLDRALRLLTAPSEAEFRHARETVHGLIESLSIVAGASRKRGATCSPCSCRLRARLIAARAIRACSIRSSRTSWPEPRRPGARSRGRFT